MSKIGIVATVPLVKVVVDGDQHTGWLPISASTPAPLLAREVDFRIEVHFDGFGYLLCYASLDGSLYGDTWHETMAEAKDVAEEDFGVQASEWRNNSPSPR